MFIDNSWQERNKSIYKYNPLFYIPIESTIFLKVINSCSFIKHNKKNKSYQLNKISLLGKYYTFDIYPSQFMNGEISIKIIFSKRIEMFSRFGIHILNTFLPIECCEKIINNVVNEIDNEINDTELLLQDYLFKYGKLMDKSILKMNQLDFYYFEEIVKYILNLCQNYSYSYRYIKNWNIDLRQQKIYKLYYNALLVEGDCVPDRRLKYYLDY